MSEWRSDPNGFNESVIDEFRANGGVVGGELADMPLLLLTTIDRRSGQRRTTPLAYHRRGNRYLIIASNGGAARNPAWFRNLERDPGVTVEVGVGTFAATATILEASERDAVFATIVVEAQNTVFHSSSFLQGQNAEYVEQLHARYADDPASVDASWQAFFRGLDDAAGDVSAAPAARAGRAPTGRRRRPTS